MSIIIGIDPGSRKTGYGIIYHSADKIQLIETGTIRTTSKEMPIRLRQIFTELNTIIQKILQKYPNEPIQSAIEQVFMDKNPDSALKLGQARGCAITALVANNISVAEYSARQIKQAVCGYGNADKLQVQAMVCRILKLSTAPQEDASDALACAICHFHSYGTTNKLLATNNSTRKKISQTARRKGRWRMTEEELLKRK